jgi:hypothetical protein
LRGKGRGTREKDEGILNGGFWRAVGLGVERGKWERAGVVTPVPKEKKKGENGWRRDN